MRVCVWRQASFSQHTPSLNTLPLYLLSLLFLRRRPFCICCVYENSIFSTHISISISISNLVSNLRSRHPIQPTLFHNFKFLSFFVRATDVRKKKGPTPESTCSFLSYRVVPSPSTRPTNALVLPIFLVLPSHVSHPFRHRLLLRRLQSHCRRCPRGSHHSQPTKASPLFCCSLTCIRYRPHYRPLPVASSTTPPLLPSPSLS